MFIKSKTELEQYLSRLTRASLTNARSSLAENQHVVYEAEEETEEDEESIFDDSAEEATAEGETEEVEASAETITTDDTKETEAKTTQVDAIAVLDAEENIPELGDVTGAMIVQKLNSVRSGRSLKDATISQEMANYLKRLSAVERLTLWTFLNGLSQVLGGTVSGNEATEPDSLDNEIVIQTTATEETETATDTPVRVRVN